VANAAISGTQKDNLNVDAFKSSEALEGKIPNMVKDYNLFSEPSKMTFSKEIPAKVDTVGSTDDNDSGFLMKPFGNASTDGGKKEA